MNTPWSESELVLYHEEYIAGSVNFGILLIVCVIEADRIINTMIGNLPSQD